MRPGSKLAVRRPRAVPATLRPAGLLLVLLAITACTTRARQSAPAGAGRSSSAQGDTSIGQPEADAAPAEPVDPERGELIVFVRRSGSTLARDFEQKCLPEIRIAATELGVAVRVIDIERGAPSDVAITPLLVYQNWRGRSVFQGRYSGAEKLRTFLRTARNSPQAAANLVREHVPVWSAGRARVAAPLKIAAVTGRKPAGYNHDEFVRQAQDAVLSGFTRFRLAERVELGRSDRQFYMDFNPWVSDNGELYLSVALFSQFHCKQPVYTHDQQPLRGPWPERERLFRQAAAAMEAAVVEQMAHSTSGDGFEPVPERIALLSWEQLGLSLPPRPAAATAAPVERPLPRRWRLAPVSADAPPHVAFRFAPPLEQYAGEARTVRADVYLDNNGGLASSRMRFEVDVASITMGDPELDEVLRGSTMLAAARHPTSSWVLDHTDGGAAPLRFGETTDAVLEGRFLLKGTTTPLTVRASFEPQVDADGRPRLLMQAAFQLDIKPFGLEVPDGPEPARSTVEFDIDLLLEPVEPKQTR